MSARENKFLPVEWSPGSAAFTPAVSVRERELDRLSPFQPALSRSRGKQAVLPLPYRGGWNEYARQKPGTSPDIWRVVPKLSRNFGAQEVRRDSRLGHNSKGYVVERIAGRPLSIPAVSNQDLAKPRKTASGRLGAFSLIEFIGVLAVIAILAAAIAPAIIKRIDLAAYQSETTSLKSLADGLTQHVLRSNNIPDAGSWVRAISAELNSAPTNVSANARRWNRAYLIDPSIWVSLPYDQSAAGTNAPAHARIMIVSSLFQPLPIASGMPSTLSAFNDIWNTPQRAKPTNSVWATWKGTVDDLLIQRVNLAPLFHRLILVNGAGGQGYFSINSNSNAPVSPGGTGMNSYYLDGTALGLYGTNRNNPPLVTEVIRSDMSRVFEYGIWRDQISLGVTNSSPSSAGLGSLAAQFFTNSPPPVSPNWGETPQTIVGLMNTYMSAYTAWASASPQCFGGPNGTGNDKFGPYEELSGTIRALSNGGLVP
jgi:type II secretory pathway pseudopilin PulG